MQQQVSSAAAVPYVDLGPISHSSIKKGVSLFLPVTYTSKYINYRINCPCQLSKDFAPIPLDPKTCNRFLLGK